MKIVSVALSAPGLPQIDGVQTQRVGRGFTHRSRNTPVVLQDVQSTNTISHTLKLRCAVREIRKSLLIW
jgi:hypothetical protein